MFKQKQKLHQELFKSVKEKQERERDAYLPPGLNNYGNTCFMNSVLQGLLASQGLYDLAHFHSNHQPFQTETSGPILANRSPQLTNGHGLGGSADHRPLSSMPLGDAFVHFLLRAWTIQDNRTREIATPKGVLAILGRKYDQYLDFRQQDAHEFLRLLLDAMRMEELDVIKKVQPPPPKPKRKPKLLQPHAAPDTPEIPPGEKLQSFIDMLFGGKLASFLVCETCKHISHTYEDFNDLSLSIKPEDFAKDSKRHKFKSFAKKFAVRYDSDLPPISRASSVPPDVARKTVGDPPEYILEPMDPRVRSQEDLHENAHSDADGTPSLNLLSSPGALAPNAPHVEFVEPDKDRKSDPDRWVKLSRRLSRGMQVRKSERSRSRGRPSRPDDEYLTAVLVTSGTSDKSPTDVTLPSTREATPDPSEPPSRAASPHLKPIKPLISDIIHSCANGSHKHNLTSAKSAYLRHILADITPANTSNPFSALLLGVASVGASAHNGYTLWNKISQIPSVEESLRLFTSVEMMEGENMVGCRNCWKIANGPKEDRGDSSDTSESDKDDPEPSPSRTPSPRPLPIPSSPAFEPVLDPSPASQKSVSPASTSAISLIRHDSNFSLENKGPSVVSLPATIESRITTLPLRPPPLLLDRPEPEDASSPDLSPDVNPPVTYAGFTIPSISTTGPETPITATSASPSLLPGSIYNPASALLNPSRPLRRRTPRRQPVETDSSDDSFDDTDASLSDASSAGSPSVSPFVSQEDLLKNPSIDAVLSFPKSVPKPLESGKSKIPKSKQVVMRRFYKRYLIADPPLILVVHLKRFQQTSKTPFMSFSAGFKKLDDYVTFPECLDITPFLAPNKEDFGLPIKKFRQNSRAQGRCMYRLYAVVVHIGNILGGHYVAYTVLPQRTKDLKTTQVPEPVRSNSTAADDFSKSDKTNKVEKHEKHDKPDKREKGHEKNESRQWAYISDTVVRLTTLDEVLKSKAYMCLYERIS